MDLYDAIRDMRHRSQLRQPFSIMFMSYDRTRQTTHGIVSVPAARLKPRAKAATYANNEIIEEYIDLDTGESKKFYQCTLMQYNGQPIQLL